MNHDTKHLIALITIIGGMLLFLYLYGVLYLKANAYRIAVVDYDQITEAVLKFDDSARKDIINYEIQLQDIQKQSMALLELYSSLPQTSSSQDQQIQIIDKIKSLETQKQSITSSKNQALNHACFPYIQKAMTDAKYSVVITKKEVLSNITAADLTGRVISIIVATKKSRTGKIG